MKTKSVILLIILIVIIAVIGWWIYATHSSPTNPANTSGSTTGQTTGGGTPESGGIGNNSGIPAGSGSVPTNFDQSVTDGAIKISYPSSDFTLAKTQAGIKVVSYIPPCNGNFDDCLYYTNTSTYLDTNFESAGIRIDERTDLTTEQQCLTTEPDGFSNMTSTIATNSSYDASVFPQVGGAAAGHFANGSLYRLYLPSGQCYEFETRIGQSDFENYPPGKINQFTTADQAALQAELAQVLATLTITSSGEAVTFPQAP